MGLDANKPLEILAAEWSLCNKCALGERRLSLGGKFVFGTGHRRGIMLIGEGPGKQEEAEGTPFVGRSGRLMRKILDRLNVTDVCYFTNIVTCRSCVQETDDQGNLKFYRARGVMVPKYKDQPPSPIETEACKSRLYEEIYLVDPLLIVSLGGTAASTLLNRPVTITREAGQETHLEIPGIGHLPSRTEKKGEWVRKLRGTPVMPTERNKVRYLLIPTLHPAYVARSGQADYSDSSPLRQFFTHLKLAALDYIKLAEQYKIDVPSDIHSDAQVEEVWGDETTEEEDVD